MHLSEVVQLFKRYPIPAVKDISSSAIKDISSLPYLFISNKLVGL